MNKIELFIQQNKEFLKKLILALIFVIVLVIGIYYYQEYEGLRAKLENPDLVKNEIAQQEVDRLVGLLNKHMILPTESPTIYLISSPEEALAAYGDFFKDAKVDDRLFIYTTKAVIYRESEDIIVNVGPIAFKLNAEPTTK